MSAIMITGPAAEPVTLDEAKDYLRIDGSESDAVLARLIAAARTCIEGMTRRALIDQAWRYLTPPPSEGRIKLGGTPLRRVTAVRLFGPEGRVTELDAQDYVVRLTDPAVIHLRHAPSDATGAEVDAELGYGATPADVPQDLRQALLQLVAHWFERREPVATGAFAEVPLTVSAQTAPYRAVGL